MFPSLHSCACRHVPTDPMSRPSSSKLRAPSSSRQPPPRCASQCESLCNPNLGHVRIRISRNVLLIPTGLCLLELPRLILTVVVESILSRHSSNAVVVEHRQLLRRPHIRHVFEEALCKDEIDLFQTALLRLGVEDVDEGEEPGIDAREHEVRAPADVVNHDGRDHDDHEVEKPIRACRHGIGFCARLDRVDLGGIQPWQGKPGRAEKGNVGE
jgi:hypothetical protein